MSQQHPPVARSVARPVASASSARTVLRLAAATAVAALGLAALPAAAIVQDQPPQTQPQQQGQQQQGQQGQQGQQASQPSQELIDLVDDFYFSAATANYDAARAYGQQILDQNPDPSALLAAFRQVQVYRTGPGTVGQLDQQFARWQNLEQIGELTQQIVERVNEGRRARATDPEYIREQVERLGNGGLAYRNAVQELRNSGGYAVPTMLAYLGNPDRADLHGVINRALRDIGLPALNPLLAATEMDDEPLLTQVILTLGELGYPEAIPYILERLEQNPGLQIERAATTALGKLGYSGGSNAATEYRNLAERFWLNDSNVRPDARFPGANVWKWQNGALTAQNVPTEIFDEIMAMRTAAEALALGGEGGGSVQDEALALWLASNYRRAGELPAGVEDPTRPEGTPDAGYYGTQAGVNYLQAVLDRVMAERELPPENRYDSADVALRAIRSLQQVIGEQTLSEGESPLTRAMNYPDRRVRIEAAMALAQALPTRPITGSEQVVPLLADALSQTGEPVVLVVMPETNRDALNTTVETLEGADYRALGATSASAAAEQAQALPGVDILLIDSAIGAGQANQLLSIARGNPKLSGAAKLVLTETGASAYEQLKQSDPTLATTTAREGDALLQAVSDARTQVGGLPLNEEGAGDLAVRAGVLLKEIGLGSSIYNLGSAQPQLLGALDDERVNIQQLAAEIVALLDGAEPQRALLQKATNPDTVEAVQVAALNGLAESAKRIGNQLSQEESSQLLELSRTAESLAVRSAAAEAVGALSLPVEQIRTIIVEQDS